MSWQPPMGGSVLAGPGFAQQFAFDDAAGMTPGNVQGFGNMLNWSQIPGTSGLVRDGEFGDLPTVDNAALDEWLSSNGYKIMDSPTGGKVGYRWIQDAQGNVIGEPTAYERGTDPLFLAAGLAATGLTGANVLAAGFGASGAGAGVAASGGAAPSAGAAGGAAGGTAAPSAGAYGAGLGAETAAGLVAPGAAGSGGGLLAAPGAAGGAAAVGGAAAALPSWLPGGLAPAWEVIKQNPRLAGAIAGGLLGGVGSQGGDEPAPYTGPMPTIKRGNFQASAMSGYKPMQAPQYGGGLLNAPQGSGGLSRYMGILGG